VRKPWKISSWLLLEHPGLSKPFLQSREFGVADQQPGRGQVRNVPTNSVQHCHLIVFTHINRKVEIDNAGPFRHNLRFEVSAKFRET
jgi:hypothetical protein